ncbi:MAG: hypothetical protein AB8G11_03855 [Saprospiraceae bacterium]
MKKIIFSCLLILQLFLTVDSFSQIRQAGIGGMYTSLGSKILEMNNIHYGVHILVENSLFSEMQTVKFELSYSVLSDTSNTYRTIESITQGSVAVGYTLGKGKRLQMPLYVLLSFNSFHNVQPTGFIKSAVWDGYEVGLRFFVSNKLGIYTNASINGVRSGDVKAINSAGASVKSPFGSVRLTGGLFYTIGK